ncbi:MAG: redoxin domain-containing protein [Prevotella sp.]|nr:redoxin domain-containing protein [Prevotella sp.]MDD7273806.1 redoxin domain-containing protein [Prevotellaceae bacterium]MDY3936400.1 redoxin domain-containing protein [Prevotella sp.]MDY4217993.1 redoxin domain-containing protein [Prevotella sp.]
MKRIILFTFLWLAAFMGVQAQELDAQYAKKLLKPGVTAPNFTLQTADGKNIQLSDYRGSYVVLDFWASWCGDCRKDIPAMKALWKDFNDYNVRFIGISFDTNKDAWVKTYWETYQMNWMQVSELKKWKRETFIDRLYNVEWIPTMYLIDPQGKVVMGTVEINRLRQKLEALKPSLQINGAAVDVNPEFVGGKEALDDYLQNNQRYTFKTQKMKMEASVLAVFNVEMDGSITGIKVMEVTNLKATNPKFSQLKEAEQKALTTKAAQHFRKETIRLLSAMPKWTPAQKNGRPVQGRIVLRLNFDPASKGAKKQIHWFVNLDKVGL